MSQHLLTERLLRQAEQLRCAPAAFGDVIQGVKPPLESPTQAAPGALTCAYTWMQVALHCMAQGWERPALQAWFQAGQYLPSQWDEPALRTLGIKDSSALRDRSADMSVRRAARLTASLQPFTEAHGPAAVFRINRSLAGYLGQARVFSSHPTQQPKLLYVPGLSTNGWINPKTVPLAQTLTAAFKDIQQEFEQALQRDHPHEPFMGQMQPEVAQRYVTGSGRASWDAIFFDRHGCRNTDVHARYPQTSAVLDSAARCCIERQSPETCFSILQPKTRIEPHYGVTNARVVVHLPLRVPAGCYLELVGVDRHHWQEGEIFAFDDTFCHAAENPSDQVRGILLTDAWHPELSDVERQAFTALITTLTDLESPPSASTP
ncbi:MAG: aspartyl/asparaginyl beta-hydroxylase domain-containing protein [Betaproteobacteria bacterium]|nr:aspartyl/asparaginyl beta-hydroxylase domain-containing protein [Betaproteobacteria bacterium]